MIKIDEHKTKYTVKLSTDFIPSNETILYLYRPIIGSEPLSLYYLLYTEARNPFAHSNNIDRILKLSNNTFDTALESVNKLELIGLINIFKDKNSDDEIVIVLNQPLSVHKFLKQKTLAQTLKEIVGPAVYNENINYLQEQTFEFTAEFELVKDDEQETTVETVFNTEPIKTLLDMSDINTDF
jgi:replication initiation and membrane attachment protein